MHSMRSLIDIVTPISEHWEIPNVRVVKSDYDRSKFAIVAYDYNEEYVKYEWDAVRKTFEKAGFTPEANTQFNSEAAALADMDLALEEYTDRDL